MANRSWRFLRHMTSPSRYGQPQSWSAACRRAARRAARRVDRDRLTEPFAEQIAGWVAKSRGKVAADVVHDKLVAMGYGGSARTTRRAVAAARTAWRAGNRRVYMPWVPEPGGWLQV